MCTITSWVISFPCIFMVSGMATFAHILLAIFFAGYVRVAYDHALLWISLANLFLWMTAARCANAATRISDGCVVVQGIMPLPPCAEMCHDLRTHVSIKSNPARFRNE